MGRKKLSREVIENILEGKGVFDFYSITHIYNTG